MEIRKENAEKAYKERKELGNDTQRSTKKQKTAWMDHLKDILQTQMYNENDIGGDQIKNVFSYIITNTYPYTSIILKPQHTQHKMVNTRTLFLAIYQTLKRRLAFQEHSLE